MQNLHYLRLTGIGTYLWRQGKARSRRPLLVGCRRGIVSSSTWLRTFPFSTLVGRSLRFWRHTHTGDNRRVNIKQLLLLMWQTWALLPATSEWKMWIKKGFKKEEPYIFSINCSYYIPLPVFFALGPIHIIINTKMHKLSMTGSKYTACPVRPLETSCESSVHLQGCMVSKFRRLWSENHILAQ
jgi:hypothetical protein